MLYVFFSKSINVVFKLSTKMTSFKLRPSISLIKASSLFSIDILAKYPVEISSIVNKMLSLKNNILAIYDASLSFKRSLSAIVPLLITSTIPLLTIPLTTFGSSSCSHIATL